MNKVTKFFYLDIALLILFVLSLVSLAAPAGLLSIAVHAATGVLAFLGTAVHVVWHRPAGRSAAPPSPSQVDPAGRRSRHKCISLFVALLLSAVTGWFWLTLGGLGRGHIGAGLCAHIHVISGGLACLLMGMHVWHHRKWLAAMARKNWLSDMRRTVSRGE